jgi:hypothetical protein
MVNLRSRRLDAIFGVPLAELTPAEVHNLVAAQVTEDFDLDFKRDLYGASDGEKRSLAADVAALANAAGGLLLIGVEEDEHARAVATPGVAVTDAEISRVRQIIASNVAPVPLVDAWAIGSEFLAIAVPRSPLAPHAVVISESLRFPRRHGRTTLYLREAELAAAYADRARSVGARAERAELLLREGLEEAVDDVHTYLAIALVPNLAGALPISAAARFDLDNWLLPRADFVVLGRSTYERVTVGPGRFIAESWRDRPNGHSPYATLHLYEDGAGTYVSRVNDKNETLRRQTENGAGVSESHRAWGGHVRVGLHTLVLAVVSGLLVLGEYARDHAAAGGAATAVLSIGPGPFARPIALATTSSGEVTRLGDRAITKPPTTVRVAALLDELAEPGPALIAAAAELLNRTAHLFGLAEIGHLTRDGSVTQRATAELRACATANGIQVI